jgi:hypothetical protein
MAEYKDREHYIPLRKADLIDLLCKDKGLSQEERENFRQFCRIISSIYHFEYLERLEDLKTEYAPFDPDRVTVELTTLTPQEREQRLDRLFENFRWLLERANYKRLTKEDIEAATKEVSDWGLNMDVDFDVFERIEGFVRGDVMGTRSRRRWWKLWRKEEVRVPLYQRLVFMLKLRKHKRLGSDIAFDKVFLKIFKDIPKMDLEMLLPGARIQMPRFTVWKLGTSMFGGLAWIVYTIVRSILAVAVLSIWALYGPVAALLGYGYKQWYGYQTTKQMYSLQLTTSLYFQNLDNNGGVLFHLLDEAEEQECREAILGYYYLWRYAGEQGWTAASLDDYVELELEQLVNLKVDFEIEDALQKLEKLNLVEKVNDRYRAVPLAKALETLDSIWDNYFRYANPEPEKAPVG